MEEEPLAPIPTPPELGGAAEEVAPPAAVVWVVLVAPPDPALPVAVPALALEEDDALGAALDEELEELAEDELLELLPARLALLLLLLLPHPARTAREAMMASFLKSGLLVWPFLRSPV